MTGRCISSPSARPTAGAWAKRKHGCCRTFGCARLRAARRRNRGIGALLIYQDKLVALVAVSATSPDKEAAVHFLEAYVQNVCEIDRALLSKSWKEPVINPDYENEMQQAREYLEQVQEMLRKTEGLAEKRQYEESIGYAPALQMRAGALISGVFD